MHSLGTDHGGSMMRSFPAITRRQKAIETRYPAAAGAWSTAGGSRHTFFSCHRLNSAWLHTPPLPTLSDGFLGRRGGKVNESRRNERRCRPVPAWGQTPRQDMIQDLRKRTFLLGSQLALPGDTVGGHAVPNPLLYPAVVDDRNRQDALATHASIADNPIVLHSRRRPS